MRAGQLEPRQTVIELRPLPVRRAVATGAIRREFAGDMVGILRCLVIGDVAGVTVPTRRREHPAAVAGVAVETHVRPRELKRRRAAMVEHGARPRDGRVATGAVLGEARLGMVGIPCGGVLRRVATETILGRSGEYTGLVAGAALNAGMGALQGETRELVVIEAQRSPVVHTVALRATQRDSRRLVVEGLGLPVVLQVAGDAIRAQTRVLCAGCVPVTGFALRGRVRAQQRKPVLMRSDLLDRALPALHRMALFALGAEFAAMDVGVTVRAFRPDIGEHEPGVT